MGFEEKVGNELGPNVVVGGKVGNIAGRGVTEMEGRGDRASLGRKVLVGEGVTAALMTGLSIGGDGGGAEGDITPLPTGCADADGGNDKNMKTPIAIKGNVAYNLEHF